MADNRPVPMPPHIKAELERLRALMATDAEAYRRREIGSKRMEEEAKKIQPLRPLSAADTDLEYLPAAKGGVIDMDRMRLELMNGKKKFLEPSVEKGVMYHGTASNIKQFKNIPRKQKFGATPKPEAHFVSAGKNVANHFAVRRKSHPEFGKHFTHEDLEEYMHRSGANVMPVHVQVTNPFDIGRPEHLESIIQHLTKNPPPLQHAVAEWSNPEFHIQEQLKGLVHRLKDSHKKSKVNEDNYEILEEPHIQKAIKDMGHDAFYTTELRDRNLGIFDPKKIKSAIGNRGTYDTTNPDITKAEGGAVNPFDYENPEHVSTVAGHVSKHKDFSKLPDASKHLGEMLSQGSYKHLEDPRVQMGMRKAGHNSYYTQEKTGKKLNKMVINKAVGGAVPSMNQMRAELLGKKPTSLSDLSTIGANEAPNMNVKAYIPPSGGQLPVGGISLGNQPLPVGGIDMSQQQGHQLMPNNLMPPQGAPQGQPPQAGGMPSPLSAGASSPAQQPPSNILQMTPQGQALNAMSPPKMADGGSIPMTYKVGGSDNMPEAQPSWYQDDGEKTFNIDNLQQLAKGGKIEVRPTVFDDAASRRNEKIEAAARALMEGDMKQKAYEKLVKKEKPVKPYDFIPRPATDEEALSALDVGKKPKWRGHESWPAGHRVGLRLDIPSYEHHGVWVNSIHDESGNKKFPTSYGPVSSVRNAEFQGAPHKAVRVATGEQSKAPFAKIIGDLEHMTEEQAIKHFQKYFKHPDYRQVGYDPRRHGDFYDRETMEPITHAEHVVQIGPLVLAKKPKYGKREIYAKGGSAKPKKPLHYAPAPPMKKAEIEAHAERMARQMAGLDNPTGKTLQQLAREKDLNVGIKSSKKNEQPIIDYQNLKGSYSVGVPGDTSRGGIKPSKNSMESPLAGEYLKSIGFEDLEQPVGMYGGKDYGAYGHPAGWASDLGASRGMFNVVQRLAKENPDSKIFGHYHKMSPEALHHAVHMLDAVLAHHQPHKLPPEQIEILNHLMRNVKTTTNKNDVPYPEFAGFENPADIRLQAPFNSGMRKKIISMLGKEKHMAGGKQKLDDIIYAISHPELRNVETGAGGSSIIQFDPSRSLKESISPHPTYGHDIPSELVGRTRYLTPADILAPRSMHNARKEIAKMGKKVIPFNQAKMNIIREPIDEQYINQMGEYEQAMKKRLGYKKGGKVKLSTNMDTINLELSRRTKKAK